MPFVAAPVKIPEDIRHILSNLQKAGHFQPARYSVAGTFPQKSSSFSGGCRKKTSHLEEAVSSFLNDCPRPGQPSHYTDEQIIKILEIACRDPQEFGYEVSHWSLNLLVDAVIKEGIVDSISAKTVSRFFNMGEIHPHLIRYWLHSSEKVDSPETFAEKVNEICTVYHEAEEVREKGGHTISVDEMTGIQALEHKYPDKPVIPGKAARMHKINFTKPAVSKVKRYFLFKPPL
ncbi:helix-turn-helix domain-containing protein [Ruminococcus sp. AF31-8BH]|uniref:helix-turn-helix domain-containing protein n=1 Tax=Ruminococcus sp. AF31-8BH TaxID=2293174 RepID=UPI001FA864A4|nr:helix-turn-helix domain-containing protein [Ruminococcus sp. AF31-8BH]